ncbi:MAG: Glycosyl transferase family 2 [candidate division WS6 bacterium GW2011_GWF2_39_15]|uniref:Glycosyl transferase family 2 n=1 Tax=candidate division WS6 bacterium GW2011_GWF2_39_15 TaxID=1619100 RepID=A0A0G0MZF3_9BACT|nr:MAG: Glycosyl transferase family 2 [candidate division WS6 bacterium GW2011_GWF2_39_15]
MENEINDLLTQKNIKISCIIPAYNEGETVENVLKIISSYSPFSEIILVNDGSKDQTRDIFMKYETEYPKIRVISNETNNGKTNAIIKGVANSKGQLLVFIDADLLTLTHDHLDRLITPVLKGEIDMAILSKESDDISPIGWSNFIVSRPLGGERAIWKKDFEKIHFDGDERYGLEVMLNTAYINMNKRIRTIRAPKLLSLYQSQKKQSLITALLRWKGMLHDIHKVTGVKGYVKQAVEVEEDRLRKLYEVKERSRVKAPMMAGILVAGLTLSTITFLLLNTRNRIEKTKGFLKKNSN